MKPVLAFLTLADFLKLFGGKLHFSKRRGNETPNEIEVNLDLLRGLNAALAVTLMHQDFLDKLIEHGNGQLVEVLVLVNQSDKTISDIVNIGLHFFHKDVRLYAASCSEV